MELNTDMEKASYSIGVDVGQTFEKQKLELIPEFAARGLKDGMKGDEPLLTKEEMEETLKKFSEERMARQKSDMAEAGGKNIKEGEEFLAANKEKEGVITTASGLQYKVINEGTGRTPKSTDTVETHYSGTLIDGTEFDSSYKRGQPATFPVSGVIPGWTEALLLMKEGAKWQLFIPSDLAYGERGAGGDIGSNATLIFDIELIAIK
ncbi:MAG: FKBP-type peptidyl-prolyl cis-trans isomerase [Calditrichaeota bacterium]|nr:FKBP-type peptidyl-prolyl cis-trans isomerase [Calditrichota bacterium]